MSVLVLTGGNPLSGTLSINGAKNSVLPILAATLLADGVSVIDNCPDLSDVRAAIDILTHLGCRVEREGRTIRVDASSMDRFSITDELMMKMRSSVIFLGAILARCGRAELTFPGGCELGPRPIDLHLAAMRQLGFRTREEGGRIFCKAEELKGADIHLTFPSVGATENILLAASVCPGTTRIVGAAREPEIVDLADFLSKCGLKVTGAGESVIEIEGGGILHPCEHSIIPDRIETATYLSVCAAAGGKIELRDAEPEHLGAVISLLRTAGAEIRTGKGRIYMRADQLNADGLSIKTMPYPGFPTDAQPMVMAALASARGTAVFEETIFESRYRHVSELVRMGANIRTFGKVAVVTGVPRLYGAAVHAADLRGGAALVTAAAGAFGVSRVTGLSHVDRGYEKIERSLRALGVDIKREDSE